MFRSRPPLTRTFAWSAAAATYVVSLAVQAAVFLAVRPPASPVGDPGYAANAVRMLTGGYADTFKPPLYSLFLVVPTALDGLATSFYFWQMVAYAAIAPATWLIGFELELPRRPVLLAVAIEVAYPYYAFAFLQLLETGLAVLAVKAVWLAWLRGRRSERWRAHAVWGAAFGVATLVRPNLWSVLPVLCFFDRRNSMGVTVARYALFTVGLTLALWPWLEHTHRVTGRASITPTNAGYNLLAGHNPHAAEYLTTRGKLLEDTLKDHPELLAVESDLEPLQRDRELWHRGLAYAREHPLDELRLIVLKARAYWAHRLERDYGWAKQAAYGIPYVLVLLLAVRGAWIGLRRGWEPTRWILGVIVSHMLPFVVFIATVRMRMPVEFLLMLLAAIALDDGLDRAFTGRRYRLRNPPE